MLMSFVATSFPQFGNAQTEGETTSYDNHGFSLEMESFVQVFCDIPNCGKEVAPNDGF